jgi:hypothetical protein
MNPQLYRVISNISLTRMTLAEAILEGERNPNCADKITRPTDQGRREYDAKKRLSETIGLSICSRFVKSLVAYRHYQQLIAGCRAVASRSFNFLALCIRS